MTASLATFGSLPTVLLVGIGGSLGALARYAVGVDRSRKKTVPARREIGEVDRALFRKLAPLVASTFELVLITQPFAGAESQCHVLYLNLILVRS